MNIILIAPPASGKGTQSELLKNKYHLTHISTGDLLREEINNDTEIGKQIKEVMNEGLLVSDEIVLKLLSKKIASCSTGFILDGFPRNIRQAEDYIKLLDKLNIDLGDVIFIDTPKDIVKKRIIGRLSCPDCKAVYNSEIDALKPSIEGVCNNCGSTLVRRSDDNEETFEQRYDTYIKETIPLIEFFNNKGILSRVDGTLGIDEIFNEIEKVIM